MSKMKVELKVKPPTFPNFVKFIGEGELTLSIGALSDEELEHYAEIWKQGLITHAKSRRGAFSVTCDSNKAR